MVRLQFKLDGLSRELLSVTEAEYNSGLAANIRPPSPRQLPLGSLNNVVAHPQPQQQHTQQPPQHHREQYEEEQEAVHAAPSPPLPRMPDSGKGSRAEGTGREILLQVRARLPPAARMRGGGSSAAPGPPAGRTCCFRSPLLLRCPPTHQPPFPPLLPAGLQLGELEARLVQQDDGSGTGDCRHGLHGSLAAALHRCGAVRCLSALLGLRQPLGVERGGAFFPTASHTRQHLFRPAPHACTLACLPALQTL